MTYLNTKCSRYDGTEVVLQDLSPPNSSKYVSKSLKMGPQQVYWHELREVLHTTCDRKAIETNVITQLLNTDSTVLSTWTLTKFWNIL